jgi:hypothetical protein
MDNIIMNTNFEEPKKGSKIAISSSPEHVCDDKRRSLQQAIMKKN